MNQDEFRELPNWLGYMMVTLVFLALIVLTWLYYNHQIQAIDKGIELAAKEVERIDY